MSGSGRRLGVYLVDDQDLFRAGLRMIVDSQPDLHVVGESSDAVGTLREVPALRPDVVLMDIRMPQVDGIEATRRLGRACAAAGIPLPRVLMLTTLDTEQATREAITAGASGFMLKDAEPDLLLGAVRALAVGAHIIVTANPLERADRASADAVATSAHGGAGTAVATPHEFARLTERERDVFAAVSHGLNNREIAATLHLGEATVKTHLTAVLQKLGLRDRVQVVVYAYEHGLAG